MAPIAGLTSSPTSHDYTEGASAIDIDSALANTRRSRRDSQYSTMYGEDGEGAMFDGPGHSVNPSSVSRMTYIDTRRRSSDNWSRSRRRSRDSRASGRGSISRRSSKDSQVSRQSIAGDEEDDVVEEDALIGDDVSGTSRYRTRRRSVSPQPKPGVFGGLAQLFGRGAVAETSRGRRPSLSQYSTTSRRSRRSRASDVGSEHALDTDEEEEERWGYSSGEEDSDNDSVQSMALIRDDVSITASMEYESDPPSPSNGSYGIPLLSSDPVFGGEARIDMEFPFTLHDPPPPGPPSRQTIFIEDEDSTIQFVGYETVRWRVWLWRAGCILTLGILGLVGHWFPRLWLRCVAREKAFIDSRDGFIVVEVNLMSILLFLHLNGLQDCTQGYHAFPGPRPRLPISHNICVFFRGAH